MSFHIKKNSKLRLSLGEVAISFLEYSLLAFTRILPHTETYFWQISQHTGKTQAIFSDAKRRELRITLAINDSEHDWTISFKLQRRKIPAGVGAVSRTIDLREKDIAQSGVEVIEEAFRIADVREPTLAAALRATIDERIVARHLQNFHGIGVDLGVWFAELRRLAEQSYENKSLAFGCIIDTKNNTSPEKQGEFPGDYLALKKYRALSDGYRTVYRVSSEGAITGFSDLKAKAPEKLRFYPEWCEDIASHSRGGYFGLCLTKQGDLIVLDKGRLTFTYRSGKWQYWNHGHIADLIASAARVQHVDPTNLSGVVRAIYRASLDVSFRRTGGLFVLLRNQKNIKEVVRTGDAIGDKRREEIDRQFDAALNQLHIQHVSRGTIADLAALDGAIVLSNKGELLAYSAVLDPKKKGKVQGTEGSRTKAAIGSSNYGLAVKISSDGDITVFIAGKELIKV